MGAAPRARKRAAELAETIARAVQTAHKRGIIHRDLKPANVLIATDGTPKVADFGLAKYVDEQCDKCADSSVVGTPSYMAPEQASGKSETIGPATDVYGMGAILYELLTGRPPFQAKSSEQILLKVIGDEPESVRRLSPAVARDLEAICLKCLQKNPAYRYDSALALAEDIRRYLDKTSEVQPLRAWDWLFLSMAHHRMGNSQQAEESFDKGTKWREDTTKAAAEGKSVWGWTEQVETQLLKEQADLLIHGPDPFSRHRDCDGRPFRHY